MLQATSSDATLPVLSLSLFPDELPPQDHELWKYDRQNIQVRGFWHALESSAQGILSIRPGLKSCCFQASATALERINVNGHIADVSDDQAITLDGVFRIDPHYQNGKLDQVYFLDNAKIVKSQSNMFLWIMVGLFLFFCLFAFMPSFQDSDVY